VKQKERNAQPPQDGVVKQKERTLVFGIAVLGAIALCSVGIALLVRPSKPLPPPLVPVEGVIRSHIDGKPLKKVVVLFVPKTNYGPDYTAYGETDDDGHYTLNCNGQPGACVGENRVLIQETPPPASLQRDDRGHILSGPYYQKLGGRPLPKKYTNLSASPLTVDVQASRTQYDFTLEKDK
jgi:hypothetical protein